MLQKSFSKNQGLFKDFVIRFIETEINRDLTQRASHITIEEKTDVSHDLSKVSAEVAKQPKEQKNTPISTDFDGESEESENPDEDEDLDENEDQESEDIGMFMGM